MMTNTRHLFPGLWKMDVISARLTQLPTQRLIRGFVALLVTSVTFWCLISGDDALQNSSSHHSDGVNLAPRGTVKIQTPGAIAGLVVGTILGVLAIGVAVRLVYRVNRLKLYHGSGSTVETRRQFKQDQLVEHNRPHSVEAAKPRLQPPLVTPGTPVIVGVQESDDFADGSSWTPVIVGVQEPGDFADLSSWAPPYGESDSATNVKFRWADFSFGKTTDGFQAGSLVGAPIQFWKPTEMERDLASRISMDEGPSMAITTSAKQAPLKSSEYDTVFNLSGPDLERTTSPEPLDSSDVPVVLPVLAHIATHHTSSQPNLSSQAFSERLSFQPAERSHEDDEVAATSSQFPCRELSCSRTFSKQYKLNHHMRYHAKSKQCPTCSKSFGTVTHLERHINSAHSSTRRYHCTVDTCKYSKTVGGDAVFFSRKDNWARHMKDRHGLT